MTTLTHVAFQSSVSGEPTPTEAPITFAQFAAGVQRAVETEHACDTTDKASIEYAKTGMMAVIPARLSPEKMAARKARGEKNARGSEVVEGSAIIGLDIDKAPPDKVTAALAFLRSTGVAAVVHGSPTDGIKPGERKVRIFVAVDREATPAEIWPLRCALAEHLGLREWLDPQTSDPSRLFFAGRLQGTPPREFVVTGATPVPASALLAKYPHAAPARTDEASGVHERPASPLIWSAGVEHEQRMMRAIVALLEDEYSRGGRHVKVRSLGAVLAQAGWSDAGITAIVGQLPSDKIDARIEQALDAARLARAGERVHQLGSLEKAFGARVAKHVAELAKQPEIADLEAAAAAALAAPTPSATGEVLTVASVYAEIQAIDWVCEFIRLAAGAPTILAAYGGIGKTMLAQLLAVCIATGTPFLGYPVKKGRVRHYDYEQGKRITLTRYQRIAAALGLPDDALKENLVIIRRPPKLARMVAGAIDTDTARAQLIEECKGYTLAIFDSLRAAVPEIEEKDSKMRAPLDMLQEVSDATGCAPLVIHHNRKRTAESTGGNQEMRGTSAINDAAQVVIMLDAAPGGFNVKCGKMRDGKPFDGFGVELADVKLNRNDANFEGLDFKVINPDVRQDAERAGQDATDDAAVMAYLSQQAGGRFTGGYKTLWMALGGKPSRNRVEAALGRLARARRVTTEGSGNRQTFIITPGTPGVSLDGSGIPTTDAAVARVVAYIRAAGGVVRGTGEVSPLTGRVVTAEEAIAQGTRGDGFSADDMRAAVARTVAAGAVVKRDDGSMVVAP